MPDMRGIAEALGYDREREVRKLRGEIDDRARDLAKLRGQLALKERALQRLLVIQQEQSAEVEKLQQQRVKQMQRVAKLEESQKRLMDGWDDWDRQLREAHAEITRLEALVAAVEEAASV
jgi:chromosome segregation ATPase